ncbi:MAG: SIS domain-containing protein [Thermoplasmata archaeon]
MIWKEAYKFITSQILEVINNINYESINKAKEIILESQKIFVYGAGRSGIIGKAFAMRLVQLGLVAYFIGETITPIVTEYDAVIIISNTGNTKSSVLVSEISKNVGAKIISITSNPESEISKISNLQIILGPISHNSLAPLGTVFEDAALIFLDSFVAELMESLKQTEEDLKKRHAIWV